MYPRANLLTFIVFCLRSSNNNVRPNNTAHPLQESHMTMLMAVAFLGLKFITLSQQFNKSKETCIPQRVERFFRILFQPYSLHKRQRSSFPPPDSNGKTRGDIWNEEWKATSCDNAAGHHTNRLRGHREKYFEIL